MSVPKLSILKKFSLLTLAPAVLFGQSTSTAQLGGEITDPSGAPVSGVQLRLTESQLGIEHIAVSGSDGHYVVPGLPVGTYKLHAEAPHFKAFEQTRIILHVGDNREVDFKLELGDASETVNVVAGANLIQTEQTSVSQIISQKNIVELPLNGRQPTQLVLISGASVVTPAGDMSGTKNYFSSTTISVAGGQGNGTNYILDGGDNVDTMTNTNLPFPFPDAIQEFGVDTSALPARNGRQPGGLVTIVTKSGSNNLHGDLFEFVRNGDLNARNFFSASQDTLKRNQFGGTLGGRIIKDKLFFFGGYQGTRIVVVPGSSIAYVPTALELAGNFTVQESPTCQSSHTSKTLTGYAGNMIPVSQFDPAALKIVKLLPTSSNACGQITYGVRSTQNEDQGIGKLDWVQSEKHNLFLRYFNTQYVSPAPFDPSNFIVTQTPGLKQAVQSTTIGDSYSVSAALLNSFHVTVDRRTDYRASDPKMVSAADLGINIYTFVPNDFRLAVSNDFNIGCGTCSPGHFNTTSFEAADDIDWIHGIHHVTFGADILRTDNNLLAGYLQNGYFAFSGTVTGDPMADFLTGSLGSFSQSRPQTPTLRQSIPGLYVQDTIRLNSHLTVNAGLRWEPSLYAQDLFHRGASFSMADFLSGAKSSVYPGAPAGALYYGDQGIPAAFTNDKFTNFSPRLGLAWDPTGDGKQILRVGAALMYDSAEVYTTQRISSNPPYVNEIDLTTSKPGGLSNPWTTGYNYPGGNPFPPSAAYFPQYALWIVSPNNLHPTSVAQWNATYQRQIGQDYVVSASYIGNKTSHIWVGQELNPAIYSPAVCAEFAKGCTTSNTNQRKLLSQINPAQGQYYGNVDQIDDGANASYNALLLSVVRRLTRGVSLLANYTESHCISEADFAGDVSGPGFENPYNLAQDRGNCNFDIRHIFNASVIGTTPYVGKGFIRQITGNWQISPLVRATSGVPLNVVTGTDRSLTGVGLDRPNYVAGVDPYASGMGALQYLNPAAFKPNALGTFGDLGRDALHGPGALNIDMAVTRIIPLRERYRLEVRGEAFNVINHTNFLAPATGTGIPGISTSGINLSQNSSSFGRITSAGDPRILQIAMKLSF